ncbi:hypothetical protein F4808DRAFT_452823 [Astrocystis sublimbata]|nr:hypothetical protein F4808DRAFT_452823 [Astrocystis sublimbata]
MGDLDTMNLWDLSPVPTLVLTPSRIVSRVSDGLLEAWKCRREDFVGRDVFTILYAGSALERFDRIPLTRAIEVAVATRKVQLCYTNYSTPGASWSARVIPFFKDETLLALVLEWMLVENPLGDAASAEHEPTTPKNMLAVDETFRLLVQAVKDYAIFLLDTRGYVATWNAGAKLLKGYSRSAIVGQHFSTFYGNEDLAAGKPVRELEICLREGSVQDEGWRYRQDGSRFWANVVITAIYNRNGVHVGFGKVTRDLTERRNAELSLLRACEESAKLKNEFLANMSHEIRTPMHGMLSACALLLDGEEEEEKRLTPKQKEMADLIADSGQVLLQVINSILDYSKIASDSVSLKSEPVDVAEVMACVVRNVQVRLRPEVELKLDVSPALPKAVSGDPLRFRQIVQNIVDNAAKFTEEGCIAVQAAVVAEDATTCTVQTTVVDTGIGVLQKGDAESETLPNLYKPFTQLDTSTNKRFQGTGLGLSIAKSLVELMGGQLEYRPNPMRQGSIFSFTAKFGKVPPPPTSNGVDDPHQQLHLQMRASGDDVDALVQRLREVAPQKRILAAEDNFINQKVLVRILDQFRFAKIDVVGNGAEAVALLTNTSTSTSISTSDPAAQHEDYDLVLMDVSMPIMDGLEATAKLRQSGVRLPIVAMTAYALAGDMERVLEKGMDDYLRKPMSRNALVRTLLKWLDTGS